MRFVSCLKVYRAAVVASLLLAAGSIAPGAPAADRATPAVRRLPSGAPRLPVQFAALAGEAAAEETLPAGFPFPSRRKAPSLDGGAAWINTGGPVDLRQLRGKFVLLDFWTYCCINCMHILPELKKLEHAYPNEVVVIGVHSAKFATEQDSKNITDAVLRYEIEHPVVNDRDHKIWEKFEVTSWPSLRLIDPEGNWVASDSGETTFDALDKFLKKALPYYRKHGLLDETPLHFDRAAAQAPATPLRFPGKLLVDAAGERLFVADTGHNRIVVSKLDGTLVDLIGNGDEGAADGSYQKASFDHPQGLALDGNLLYVADTENHKLRRVDLEKHEVTTIAGTGKQSRVWGGGKPARTALNSPWALAIHDGVLYIAMAGPHQIWKMPLDGSEIVPYAGNGREDIVDGPLLPRSRAELGFASFAQPSGLASDGKNLYVADSEGSSIRAVPLDASQPVSTLVGTAGRSGGRLFTFGDVDGSGPKIRLQHPLDVAYLDGKVFVADTYNNKIKVIDLKDNTCTTLVGTLEPGNTDSPAAFDEPEGLSIGGGKLYVADTNNHSVRVIDLEHDNAVSTLSIVGLSPPTAPSGPSKPNFKGAAQEKLPAVTVKPVDNELRLHVELKLPPSYKINPLAPLRYVVEATGAKGPVERSALGTVREPEERASAFDIRLPLSAATGADTLKISLGYYYCQKGAEGVCKAGSIVWTVPVKLAADAGSEVVELPHKVK